MSFLTKLLQARRKTSASIAKERLQIIVSHERAKASRDYLPLLQRDLVKIDHLLPGLGQQSDIDSIPGRGGLAIQGPTNK